MKVTLLATAVILAAAWELWFTPDQQGDRLFKKEKFAEAAEVYRDPMRAGAAWFRADEFKKAEQAFARGDGGADAEFNRGNALVLQGEYEAAIQRYDRALELRPDWEDAVMNRTVAAARAKMTKREGGDMGDQQLGADKIVFDKNKKQGGQDTKVDESKAGSNEGMQAIWLQRMQTRPADFLRAKFAYQKAMDEGREEEAKE